MQIQTVNESKQDIWDQQFLEKNKEPVLRFIKVFGEGSYLGLSLFFLILTAILVIIQVYIKNDVIAAIAFMLGFRTLIFCFKHFPKSFIDVLFKNIRDDFAKVSDKEKLRNLLKFFNQIYKLCLKYHNSLFIKHELISVSGTLSVLFGMMLILRKIQFSFVLYFGFLFATIYFCKITYGITVEEQQSDKDQE